MQTNFMDTESYATGCVFRYQDWIGRYANQHFRYFAKHTHGTAKSYDFNSQGWRGPEFHDQADITVFGSSFSFGVGIEFEQCWHQLLGDYRVNCYAMAGFLLRNQDILDLVASTDTGTSRVIVQLREFRYDDAPVKLVPGADYFVIDEHDHDDVFCLPYASMLDRAADHIHPGPQTHQSWATTLKHKFGL